MGCGSIRRDRRIGAWRFSPGERDLAQSGRFEVDRWAEHLGECQSGGLVPWRDDLQPSTPGRDDSHLAKEVAFAPSLKAAGKFRSAIGIGEVQGEMASGLKGFLNTIKAEGTDCPESRSRS